MDVLIAGAGLMGRLLGWRLTRLGARVRLHEKDPERAPTSAAHVAAAMLAPYAESVNADPAILTAGLRSLELWPHWLDALGVPWRMQGSLVVAHRADRGLLDRFALTLARRAPGVARPACVADLEPELGGRFTHGMLLPREGWLDNRALLTALGRVCGEIRFDSPIDLDRPTRDVPETTLRIDCRGADADEPELRGVRGELLRVRAPDVHLTRPVRLMHPRYPIYVAPRPDRQYVIGATEIESDARGPVRVRSALELLSAAFSLHPGFAEAEILALDSGIRAAFPDNRPRVFWRDGVLRVNGLYRHGYLIGPTLVECAINCLKETHPTWKSSSMASP